MRTQNNFFLRNTSQYRGTHTVFCPLVRGALFCAGAQPRQWIYSKSHCLALFSIRVHHKSGTKHYGGGVVRLELFPLSLEWLASLLSTLHLCQIKWWSCPPGTNQCSSVGHLTFNSIKFYKTVHPSSLFYCLDLVLINHDWLNLLKQKNSVNLFVHCREM